MWAAGRRLSAFISCCWGLLRKIPKQQKIHRKLVKANKTLIQQTRWFVLNVDIWILHYYDDNRWIWCLDISLLYCHVYIVSKTCKSALAEWHWHKIDIWFRIGHILENLSFKTAPFNSSSLIYLSISCTLDHILLTLEYLNTWEMWQKQ